VRPPLVRSLVVEAPSGIYWRYVTAMCPARPSNRGSGVGV